jgi:HEAT repeat protein
MPEVIEEKEKGIDLTEGVRSLEGEELDEAVFQARDVMNFFVKSIKASRLYPPENPRPGEFRGQLLQKLQLFLNKYHSFVFQIGEHDFSFKEKILYENKDLNSSLAFQLYKDGLRELRFMEGLEDGELRGLIDIIARAESINKLEDDIVTMMWEADFVHLSYLAADEFLDETGVSVPQNVDEFRKNLTSKPVAHYVDYDLGDEGEEKQIDLYKILSQKENQPPPVNADRSLYCLTPDELERLRKEIETETAPGALFNIMDILFELLALEKEPEPYHDAVNALNKMVDALLTLGEFQKASDLLSRMNIILNTYQLADWQSTIIQKFIEGAGEPRRIASIGQGLEKGKEARVEEILRYLLTLRPNSIPPLMNLLGELENSKVRRALCDIICELGKTSMELITPFINDSRWYLVRNVIYILARIGKEQALPYIFKGFNHQDPRVRREAVQALGLIGSPRASAILVRALQDEDTQIRSLAALNLAKVVKKDSLPHLLEVIQSKEFHKREKAEIKAFFDAIGMIGSDEAPRPLQKLLEQKSWLGSGKKAEIRLGAANALAMIGTPEAKSILQSGRNSNDQDIREACQQAMERLAILGR